AARAAAARAAAARAAAARVEAARTEAARVAATSRESSAPVFTIQVKSYHRLEPAEKLIESLQAAGFNARIMRVKLADREFHRVRVGRFSSRQEAKTRERALKTQFPKYQSAYLTRAEAL
ncbi:MAG: SPOR domain-containing protein, partial [Myxococcota bacterium]|nr:SPOR domain-containing protein [Myxococcota bacterium]